MKLTLALPVVDDRTRSRSEGRLVLAGLSLFFQ
jgi:hypothetical protein